MSWDHLCRPIEENCLGLTSFYHLTTAFSYKLWWIYRTGELLWAKFMRSKYRDFTHFRIYGVSFSYASHTLYCILSVWEEAENHIGLIIRDGNSSFLMENRTHDCCFIASSNGALSPLNKMRCIKDVIDRRGWNLPLINSLVTNFNAECLQDISPLLVQGSDCHVWKRACDEKFSFQSALQCIVLAGSSPFPKDKF